jgi:hypothetical protein
MNPLIKYKTGALASKQRLAVSAHSHVVTSSWRRHRCLRIDAVLESNRRVLVLNAGSSSLKFKTFQLSHDGTGLLAGMAGCVERIGDEANSGLVAKGSDSGTRQAQKWELKVPTRCERLIIV